MNARTSTAGGRSLDRPTPSTVRRFADDRSGGIAVVFALSTLPIVLGVGAAVDYSRASTTKAQLQSAVDAATLAVARAQATGPQAKSLADKVISNAWGANPPQATIEESDGRIRVSSTYDVPTTLTSQIGIATIRVGAAAGAAANVNKPPTCVLAKEGLEADGLVIKGGGTMDASACGLHVTSSHPSAMTLDSTASYKSGETCVRGAIANATMPAGASAPVGQNLRANCTPVSDPWTTRFAAPPNTCPSVPDGNSSSAGMTVTITGGRFTALVARTCGPQNNGISSASLQATNPPGGAVYLQPGIWYVGGRGTLTFRTNGNLIAEGVTFYLDHPEASVNFEVDGKLILTAPQTGATKDMVLYTPSNQVGGKALAMRAGGGARITGVVYAPTRNLALGGGPLSEPSTASIVARKVTVEGTSRWTLQPYAPLPLAPGTEPRRVSRRRFGLGQAAKVCTLVWA